MAACLLSECKSDKGKENKLENAADKKSFANNAVSVHSVSVDRQNIIKSTTSDS